MARLCPDEGFCMNKFSTFSNYCNYTRGLRRTIEKDSLICQLCEGKDVLDIGCIDHGYNTALELGDKWLHKKIGKVAKSLIGIDLLEEDANLLNKEGYNIIAANAENFKTGKKFDVINAGDIIEHLTNIGEFLENVRLHLKDDGLFIITTPNPFNIEQFFMIMLYGHISVHEQHTVWIDPRVMWETVRRHHFYIDEFYWIETRFKIFNMPEDKRILHKAINTLVEFFMKMRPSYNRDYCVVLKLNH